MRLNIKGECTKTGCTLISTINTDDFHFETNEAFFAYDVYLKVCPSK